MIFGNDVKMSFGDSALGGRLKVVHFRTVADARGSLTEFDYSKVPFAPRRSYVVSNVPLGTTRGGHAHYECEQLLVCLRGEIVVNAAFQGERVTATLNGPSLGLFIGAQVWAEQVYKSEGTAMLVLASMAFDSSSYFQPDWLSRAP